MAVSSRVQRGESEGGFESLVMLKDHPLLVVGNSGMEDPLPGPPTSAPIGAPESSSIGLDTAKFGPASSNGCVRAMASGYDGHSARWVFVPGQKDKRHSPISTPPFGNLPQERGEPVVSLAGRRSRGGQGAARLHDKRGGHRPHDRALHHRPTGDQSGEKSTAITIPCPGGIQGLDPISGHVENGSVRPFADQ